MKLKLITLGALSALILVSPALANEPEGSGPEQKGGRGHHRGSLLERATERLDLTPEQQAKIQPIIDQAKPQLETIHREAMEKTKAVMDNAMSQIRPMLTPEQEKKLDDAKNERRGGHEGRGGRKGRHGQGADDEPDNG